MKLNPDGTNSYEFIGWISIAAFIITNIAFVLPPSNCFM